MNGLWFALCLAAGAQEAPDLDLSTLVIPTLINARENVDEPFREFPLRLRIGDLTNAVEADADFVYGEAVEPGEDYEDPMELMEVTQGPDAKLSRNAAISETRRRVIETNEDGELVQYALLESDPEKAPDMFLEHIQKLEALLGPPTRGVMTDSEGVVPSQDTFEDGTYTIDPERMYSPECLHMQWIWGTAPSQETLDDVLDMFNLDPENMKLYGANPRVEVSLCGPPPDPMEWSSEGGFMLLVGHRNYLW